MQLCVGSYTDDCMNLLFNSIVYVVPEQHSMMRQENHLRFDKCLSARNGCCLDQDLSIVEKEDGV